MSRGARVFLCSSEVMAGNTFIFRTWFRQGGHDDIPLCAFRFVDRANIIQCYLMIYEVTFRNEDRRLEEQSKEAHDRSHHGESGGPHVFCLLPWRVRMHSLDGLERGIQKESTIEINVVFVGLSHPPASGVCPEPILRHKL